MTVRPSRFLLLMRCGGIVLSLGTGMALAHAGGGAVAANGRGNAPADVLVPASAPAQTATSRSADQRKQDDINRVMEFFRITQPDVFDQAKALRQTDPAKFEKLIMGALSTVNRLEATKRRNPKLFDLSMQDLQLNYQSMRIAHELKRTDLPAPDRTTLTDQLKTIVAAEFDIQQQIHQMEIADLQQKIKDLDNQVHARQDDKNNLIGKRVEDLIEHNPHLDW